MIRHSVGPPEVALETFASDLPPSCLASLPCVIVQTVAAEASCQCECVAASWFHAGSAGASAWRHQ
eukprot:3645066-Pyramimonas_sp.AAC.1